MSDQNSKIASLYGTGELLLYIIIIISLEIY